MIPDIVALVPIKMESIRVPGKNIRNLGGKPLCQYILETLVEVKRQGHIKRVCVYCSSPEIKKYLIPGVELIIRNPCLDGPHVQGMEIYNSFRESVPATWYLLCHTTSPFLRKETIINAVKTVVYCHGERMEENKVKNFDSAMTVSRIKTFAWFNRSPLNYRPELGIPQTQTLSPVIWETSGLYLFQGSLLEKGTRIGASPYMIMVDCQESVDIDTEDDWKLAEAFLIQSRMKSLGLSSPHDYPSQSLLYHS